MEKEKEEEEKEEEIVETEKEKGKKKIIEIGMEVAKLLKELQGVEIEQLKGYQDFCEHKKTTTTNPELLKFFDDMSNKAKNIETLLVEKEALENKKWPAKSRTKKINNPTTAEPRKTSEPTKKEPTKTKKKNPDDVLNEKVSKKESDSFSPDKIKEIATSLIYGIKEISVIKKLKVEGNDKEMTLKTDVTSSGFNIGIQIVFENKENSIAVKSSSVDAKWPAKGKTEKALAPHLEKISEFIKKYIEEKEGREVKKIQIENSKLKVDYKK